MPAASLVLQALTRRYPAAVRPALDGLSLDVRPGELVALLGESGAGKTTALRIVAGYERPDAGAVLLDGADVTALPPERRGAGMVFQHHALFPHLSVEENVAFGLAPRGVPAAERSARAARALDGVGLGGTGARPVHALSGGEQQRVALARALVIEPRVLLLDEPLSSLDPALRIAMRDELRAMLQRSHVTALCVTHDQDDAFAIADRVALLRRGRLLQIGTPEALYDHPASRGVAEFIGRAALLPARRDGDGVHLTVRGVTQRAVGIAPADGDGAGRGWLAVLRPEALALAPVDDASAWPGEVVARRFAAGVTVCRVRLDDVHVAELETAERAVPEGARVGVRLVAACVPLVPDTSEPPDA
ncbi:ABC transporter related protein [Gemmatirosa kalamazoonensis]|uniref:ABC transporter related protein n=1 Tax=Gemmatirosa kalamazoonensis TaxID=861299 RepID=W0RBB1_9BACT|nr:ABC transporter ATP-binding protein [Gemmatirosa kalamazoonensis]AHG87600.1 ABC transporter related protein [Gemmatirosa kalamazoonensis]